jgi:CRISPR/Cas system CSM-associated protein Csm3 (group 7 of RAMP superfamily)
VAREISSRFRLTGTLVAKTPLHVGGHGDDVDTDLPLAREGRGDLYVPGTSLAGALRRWCEQAFDDPTIEYGQGNQRTEGVWGFQDEDRGFASYLVVEDVPVDEARSVVVEVRDGVGIDRGWGAAAEAIKYDRAILPRGTRLTFALGADVTRESRLEALAMLAALKDALETGRVRLGASKTRGLGQIELQGATLTEQTFGTWRGILDVLKGAEQPVADADLGAARRAQPARQAPRLGVTITWRPDGPLMVKAGFDGIAVDMLPLVSGRDGGLSLVLPGSSVKGAMRVQAERIVRTVLRLDLRDEPDRKKKFLHDSNVELVNDLFGLRGLSEDEAKGRPDVGRADDEPLAGLSALSVDDCFGTQAMSAAQWQAVQGARNDRELCEALDRAGLGQWAEAYHVAVDRWTGAAAESMLYTVLEPHRVSWEPLRLEIDLSRLSAAKQRPAVALLLLVLRDLAQGRLPLGFATHRGMGAVVVESVTITPPDSEAWGPVRQVTVTATGLGSVPDQVNTAWKEWIRQTRQGGAT